MPIEPSVANFAHHLSLENGDTKTTPVVVGGLERIFQARKESSRQEERTNVDACQRLRGVFARLYARYAWLTNLSLKDDQMPKKMINAWVADYRINSPHAAACSRHGRKAYQWSEL